MDFQIPSPMHHKLNLTEWMWKNINTPNKRRSVYSRQRRCWSLVISNSMKNRMRYLSFQDQCERGVENWCSILPVSFAPRRIYLFSHNIIGIQLHGPVLHHFLRHMLGKTTARSESERCLWKITYYVGAEFNFILELDDIS